MTTTERVLSDHPACTSPGKSHYPNGAAAASHIHRVQRHHLPGAHKMRVYPCPCGLFCVTTGDPRGHHDDTIQRPPRAGLLPPNTTMAELAAIAAEMRNR